MIFNFIRKNSLEGNGTLEAPYKIRSSKDFIFFLKAAKKGAHYELDADVDLCGATVKCSRYTFSGSFDGNGHTVANLVLTKRGLFAAVDGASFRNVSLKNVVASCKDDNFGIISANAFGNKTVFENCNITANVIATSAKKNIGGYVGSANASVDFTNCVFNGCICAGEYTAVAGFIGCAEPNAKHSFKFEGCANLAYLTANDTVGGFIAHLGDSTVNFDNCYNTGVITAKSAKTYNVFVGHFLARATTNAFMQATFENCHVIYDVSINGGKAFSNTYPGDDAPIIPNENHTLTNYCIFGYGGCNAKFEFEADHMGMDNPKYDAITKSELFFKACNENTSFSFRGLGDVVTLGCEEISERQDDDTHYTARLVGAVNSANANVGFEIITNGDVQKHPVSEVSSTVLFNGKTVTAPEGYYFITLDIDGVDDGENAVDFTVYTVKDNGFTVKDEVYKLIGTRKLPKTFDVGDGYSMDIYAAASRQYFNTYCNRIPSNYSLLQENTAHGNVFKTYYDAASKSMIHAYWIPNAKEMRVISTSDLDPALLPVCDGDGARCDVILRQLRAYTDVDGGVGFVIRLSDGRYIVIDGGHPTQPEADEIYNFMFDNLVTDEITIAAWIFTHEHGDHVGGYKAFAESYADKVTLQHILVNSCKTEEQLKHAPLNKWIYEYIDKFPGAKIHKPLSGQKYRFATTTVEILYCMSDYLPKVIPNEADATNPGMRKGNGNIQTMIFMIDLNSKNDPENKFLVLGDAPSDGQNVVAMRYEDYVRCKYYQVGHHGHVIKFDDFTDPGKAKYCRRNNCIKELYDHADPQIAFWSAGEKFFYNNRTRHGINKAFFEHMEATGTNIRAFDEPEKRTFVIKD